MNPPETIQPGTVLFDRSACDHECIYEVIVHARTAQRAKVTAQRRAEKWVKIYVDTDGSEYLMAHGRHSMAPCFRGPGLRIDTGEYAHYRGLRDSGVGHSQALKQSRVAGVPPAEVAAALAPFVSPEDVPGPAVERPPAVSDSLRPLAAALRAEADSLSDWPAGDLSKPAELLRCCARLLERGDLSIGLVHSCFGTPGDFGYSHPIGKALVIAYGCAS